MRCTLPVGHEGACVFGPNPPDVHGYCVTGTISWLPYPDGSGMPDPTTIRVYVPARTAADAKLQAELAFACRHWLVNKDIGPARRLVSSVQIDLIHPYATSSCACSSMELERGDVLRL